MRVLNDKLRGHTYTLEQKKFIAENCKGITTFQLTERLNLQFGTSYLRSQIKSYLSNNKLTNGIDCRIKKGCLPLNKGKRWAEYMSIKGQANSRFTTFKAGHLPNNHRPLGSERICSKDGYVLIKIAEPNKWTTKQRVVWESKYGKIPKGHKIIFLDGDKLNLSIENLALVSNGEECVMNNKKLFFTDQALTASGINIAKIITKTATKQIIKC